MTLNFEQFTNCGDKQQKNIKWAFKTTKQFSFKGFFLCIELN